MEGPDVKNIHDNFNKFPHLYKKYPYPPTWDDLFDVTLQTVDSDSVPVEEAVEHVVLQAGNCVCLPPDTKHGDIVIHVQSTTLCMGGGRGLTCRFLEPSWSFLGRSGGLGHKGAISRPCKAGSAMCL
eukprot:890959-Ditylum_brightwellii.AAC.1